MRGFVVELTTRTMTKQANTTIQEPRKLTGVNGLYSEQELKFHEKEYLYSLRTRFFAKIKKSNSIIMNELLPNHKHAKTITKLGEYGVFINALKNSYSNNSSKIPVTQATVLQIYEQEKKNIEFLLANSKLASRLAGVSKNEFLEKHEMELDDITLALGALRVKGSGERQEIEETKINDAYHLNNRTIQLLLGEKTEEYLKKMNLACLDCLSI